MTVVISSKILNFENREVTQRVSTRNFRNFLIFRKRSHRYETHNYIASCVAVIHGDSRYSHVDIVVSSITREARLSVTDDHCGGSFFPLYLLPSFPLGTFQDISLTNNIRARALRNRECRLDSSGNRGTIALKRLIKASAAIYHAARLVDRND